MNLEVCPPEYYYYLQDQDCLKNKLTDQNILLAVHFVPKSLKKKKEKKKFKFRMHKREITAGQYRNSGE